MKLFLLITTFFFSSISFSQDKVNSVSVIAKFDSYWFGDNYTYANCTVLYNIQGNISEKKITVASMKGLDINGVNDTVLLKILREERNKTSHYYFPYYDATGNCESVNVFTVDHAFMEGCETGQGSCEPKTFTRDFFGRKTFLIMPCGGTFSTVTLRENANPILIQEVSVEAKNCPPFFDLSNLKDGEYSAGIISCGLGGAFKFHLTSTLTAKPTEDQKIMCVCTSYAEGNPDHSWKNSYSVSPEEFTQVPPLSETFVSYATSYDLEKDGSGRVSKMIRTNFYEKTTETTIYIYDDQNRLIEEAVNMNNNIHSESIYMHREEKVYFYYDDAGKRIRKVRKFVQNPNEEVVIEECVYVYN